MLPKAHPSTVLPSPHALAPWVMALCFAWLSVPMGSAAQAEPARPEPTTEATTVLTTEPTTEDSALGPSATRGEWPGFRGPVFQGLTSRGPALPAITEPGLQVVWKRALGSGYSGVSVAGGLAVTFYSDGTSDRIAGFDAATGEPRWSQAIAPTYTGHDGSHTGPISTPLIAGGKVFGLGPRGHLFAVDAATGEPRWSLFLPEAAQAQKPYYGFASSPLLMAGVLVVEIGAPEGAAVAGFDPATGERLWTAGDDGVNYQSPMALEIDGATHLLVVGDQKLYGLEPRDGRVLWSFEYAIDESGTGNASLHPVPAGEGRLFLNHGREASRMLRVHHAGEDWAVDELWNGPVLARSYSVPVYVAGHLYGYTSRFLTCVDAATGEMKWRSRDPGDGFLSTAGDRLVIVTKKGSLHLAAASPEGYEELAAIDLFTDNAWTQPSLAGGRIYARSLGELAAVELWTTRASSEIDRPGAAPSGSAMAAALAEIAAAEDRGKAVDSLLARIESRPWVEAPDLVHFLYRGDAQDVSLAGDLIGSRLEEPMHRVPGTDLFYFSARLEPDARVAYNFIRDFDETLTDPWNDRVAKGRFEDQSWVTMPRWRAPSYFEEVPENRRGRVERHELESPATGDRREIAVYLPDGYDEGETRYPLLMVHGGFQALEAGEVPRALDGLLGSRVEPLIAIFVDRMGDGDEGETPEAYARWLAEEVLPFVDGRYRTDADPARRAHVGMGFGGYSALTTAFLRPDLAHQVATQSTFLMTSMEDDLAAAIPAATETPLSVYLEWGTYDLRAPMEGWDIAEANRRLAALLGEKGFAPHTNEVSDGFGWGAWRNRYGQVFETLFPLEEPGAGS